MKYSDFEIKIDGVAIPAPIDFSYGLDDLDVDSQRDVKTAVMDRNRVRENMYKISLTYAINDVESVSKIVNMISPESFSVEMFDILTLKRKTLTMYAGPKNMQFVNNNNMWVKGLKFNLVEA